MKKDTMNTTRKIERLLAQYNQLDGERLRHEKMAATLAEGEQSLSRTTDIENKVQFEKLSQLRLRREMVPRKIQEFAGAAGAAKAELAEECQRATAALLELINQKTAALSAKLALALQPFFPPRSKTLTTAEIIVAQAQMFAVADLETIAGRIVYHSTPGTVLFKALDRLRTGNFVNRPVVLKAAELVEIAATIERIKI
jgi:hypothetical protein